MENKGSDEQSSNYFSQRLSSLFPTFILNHTVTFPNPTPHFSFPYAHNKLHFRQARVVLSSCLLLFVSYCCSGLKHQSPVELLQSSPALAWVTRGLPSPGDCPCPRVVGCIQNIEWNMEYNQTTSTIIPKWPYTLGQTLRNVVTDKWISDQQVINFRFKSCYQKNLYRYPFTTDPPPPPFFFFFSKTGRKTAL